MNRSSVHGALLLLTGVVSEAAFCQPAQPLRLGQERSVARHLSDDEEFRLSVKQLLDHGQALFVAAWTRQDGAGRPLMKGTGKALSDPSQPLVGKRGFNRFSAPDANSCFGCHNLPYGIPGGGGDFVTNVFVLGQRFDFMTFDPADRIATRGARDERLELVGTEAFGNSRSTTGMFGAGYIEMLAREMTADLQAIRDSLTAGGSKLLVSKGISFGRLARTVDGLWVTDKVEGLPRQSLVTPDPLTPPSLVIRPWHQAGNVVSLREFSNNAFNHHHGMQSTERFGRDADPDGDGVVNELTRADMTAVTLFQAAMAVPGRVIPRDSRIEQAVVRGERMFESIGCTLCHRPQLPLKRESLFFVEPNPFNPPTNLRAGESGAVRMDLSSDVLPTPRLKPASAVDQQLQVPLFSDLKLHDITSGPDDENVEALDMNQTVWSANFHRGNRRFLTKRLWGAANEPPYFHHGRFTTMREAILAHAGEAVEQRRAFENLTFEQKDDVIEFLKTLQVLPAGAKALIVDEHFRPREWPPKHQGNVQ